MKPTPDVIISSQSIEDVFQKAQRIAAFPSTVLIEGETGVGKEVLANWIHQHSPRNNMPFIKINCASIPESLLESELFGYERGAFTGAKREGNPGLFELADKGTLLLDEISELSSAMQAKLLRVLQDREVRRVGGSWSRVIDVRMIASTNQNLRAQVRMRTFREDLYYRLNVAYLSLPPLRERTQDIAPLVDYYLEYLCDEFDIHRHVSPEVRTALLGYRYPGNVRELRNLLEGLCVSAIGEDILLTDLPPYVTTAEHPSENDDGLEPAVRDRAPESVLSAPPFVHVDAPTVTGSLDDIMQHYESRVLRQVLREESSVRNAAKRLQVSHSTLLRKLKRHQNHDGR